MLDGERLAVKHPVAQGGSGLRSLLKGGSEVAGAGAPAWHRNAMAAAAV